MKSLEESQVKHKTSANFSETLQKVYGDAGLGSMSCTIVETGAGTNWTWAGLCFWINGGWYGERFQRPTF